MDKEEEEMRPSRCHVKTHITRLVSCIYREWLQEIARDIIAGPAGVQQR